MKPEAWEFIKLLLSDEVQSSADMYFFAVNLDSLKVQAKLQLSQDYMYDMYKKQGRNVKPLVQADVDLVNKMIGESETIRYYDSKAGKIVSDGVNEFFSGKKTAEETAKLIQNKINIYLGE
jgi:ABC-type glycerol-3-phosphate transport system substrate-binding protein